MVADIYIYIIILKADEKYKYYKKITQLGLCECQVSGGEKKL